MHDIESLVSRVTQSDATTVDRADAFAEIVRRFQDMAVGYAHSLLGDFQLAEDAAQEAFVEAWQLIDRLDTPAAFPSWFRRIVHTRCTRMTRGRRPKLVGMEHAADLMSPEPVPGERLSKDEDRAHVRAALRSLPEAQRVTTTLYYISGYTQAEVAGFLGVPVGTVKYRLHAARKRLQEEVLAMVGENLHAGAPSRDDAFMERVASLVQPTTMRRGTYHYGIDPVDGPSGWGLMKAAAAGDVSEMRLLLAADPALVHVERWYQTPIHFAVREGHADALRLLLDHGAEPGWSRLWQVYGWPYLRHESSRRGYVDVLDVLTTTLANRHAYDPRHEALKAAVAAQDWQAMQAALSDEPDALRWADEDGAGVLHWAVETGVPSLIAYVMDLGADIGRQRSDGATPLLLALGSVPGNLRDRLGRSDALVMNHGAVIGTLLGGGAEYVLSAACALGDVARVQQILEDGPDAAGDLDSRRRSPLSHAAQWGHYDLVVALLDAGADPNRPEQEAPRGNALFEASAHNHVAIVELLLEAGADANASKESSGTCLTIAGYAQLDDSAETQAALRRHGARTPTFAMAPADLREAMETDDPIVYTGEQFVHQVFGGEDLPTLRLLLERHPDALRCLPLCGSMYPRWRDGLELLFAFGFGPDLRDWLGKTMLHCAAMENDVEAGALMLERGADINAVEAEDRATPLAMAARRGHEEMVIFLLERGADAGLPAEEWGRPATVARDAGHDEIASLMDRSPA